VNESVKKIHSYSKESLKHINNHTSCILFLFKNIHIMTVERYTNMKLITLN